MKGSSLLNQIRNSAVESYSRFSYRRKARLYTVGAAKTGTHSIDAMFDSTVRSAHEPDSEQVIRKILAVSRGEIQAQQLRSYIRERDKSICLDVDSSQLNFFLLEILLEEFPDARFVLTIRDCYSWLDSFINDSLRREAPKSWIRLREHRFRAHHFTHPDAEQPLQERRLYTLDGYLSYWASHIEKVTSLVPEDKLMIVKTTEITERANDIADFAGLPRKSIQLQKSHSFKNPEKYHVLGEIPEEHLEAKVQEHCSLLMERYFTEIKSINDANV